MSNRTNQFQSEADAEIAKTGIVVAKIQDNIAWYQKHPETFRAAQKLAAFEGDLAAAMIPYAAACEAYKGWSRFFLVQNTNGHIHSNMDCWTCFYNTQYAWLTELSGLTEAEAVEEFGGILCSVCFPSAPVEWTTGTNKRTADEKAAEVARKAIEKLPESKVANAKFRLVERNERRVKDAEKAIQRVEDDAAHGAETPDFMIRRADEAKAALPKLRKALAKSEDVLATATQARNEAVRALQSA